MRRLLASTFRRLADWIGPKAMPPVGPTSSHRGGFIDAYRKHREPTPQGLLGELKNTAWACASINAAVCASFPPRLFVRTGKNDPRPKCRTKALRPDHPLVVQTKGGRTKGGLEL
jgi:hypothetical protein